MAISSSFSYTNTSASTATITVPELGLNSTNYALVEGSTDTQVVYTNLTAERSSPEYLLYRSRPIDNVNSRIKLSHPDPVKGGVQWTVELQETLVTTDSDDPTFRIEHPIVAALQVRHPQSEYVTDTIVKSVVDRLYGALHNADGTWRIAILSRGSTRIY